jgi:hypothetical protein
VIDPLKTSHRPRFGLEKSYCTSTHLPRVIKEQALKAIDKLWTQYLLERFNVTSVSDLSEDDKLSLYTVMRSELSRQADR